MKLTLHNVVGWVSVYLFLLHLQQFESFPYSKNAFLNRDSSILLVVVFYNRI